MAYSLDAPSDQDLLLGSYAFTRAAGQITAIALTHGGVTWTKTFTRAAGVVTAESVWVAS